MQTVDFPRKMNRWPNLLVRHTAPLPETVVEGALESLAPPDAAGGLLCWPAAAPAGPFASGTQPEKLAGAEKAWHPTEPQLSLLQLRDSLPCFPPLPGTSLQGAALMGDAK